MTDAAQRSPRHDEPDPTDRVAANARLTGLTGSVLFVLFALEGLTLLLGVDAHLSAHVLLGMVLVPPVALKIGATTYRFSRYYTGAPDYVRRGPPPFILRLAGPVVVLSTAGVVVTGIVLLVGGPQARVAGLAHRACFVVWFAVMTVHVLGHLRETPGLAVADVRTRAGVRLAGGPRRLALVGGSLLTGLLLGWLSLGWIGTQWADHLR